MGAAPAHISPDLPNTVLHQDRSEDQRCTAAYWPGEECTEISSRRLSSATAEHGLMNSYWPGILLEPSVRTLDNMQCVLADQSGSMTCTPCTATSPSLPRTMRIFASRTSGSTSPSFLRGPRAGSTSRPEAATTRRAPRASINPGSTRIKPRVPACGIDDGRTPEDFVPRESSAAG